MKRSINLSLGKKRVDYALRKALYASAGIFCVVVVVSFGLIAYRLLLTNSYNALQEQEVKLDEQLIPLQEKKVKLSETKSRLAQIKNIIAKRSPVTERLNIVAQLVPLDSEINTLQGSRESMQVALTSKSLLELNQLMESKILELSNESSNRIAKVEMRSFGLNPATLDYSMDLVISFQK